MALGGPRARLLRARAAMRSGAAITVASCCGVLSEWHLAAQVLYFVAGFLILVSELAARMHVCCGEKRSTRNLASVGLIVLVSGNERVH